MSVNSSSFADLSPAPTQLSPSNISFRPFTNICFTSKTSIFIFSAFLNCHVLLLPLLFLILYLGYHEWRKPRSTSTSAASHSDLFIYHSIMMQLFVFMGFTCYFCGGYIDLPEVMWAGLNIWVITPHGQALFHILTCVERYLAVVHPITYRSLRQAGRVKIINISIGCVWLVSFGWLAICCLSSSALYLILYCCNMAFYLIVIAFFSIYVLCALKRSGPGEERVNQSKQRAFHTILATMGALFIRFGGSMINILMSNSNTVNPSTSCVMVLGTFWFDLPSSLVLPLLFLHRRGKLRFCKQNRESEYRKS